MVDEDRPSARLRRLTNGFQVSQAVYVAATLGVADELRAGPRTAEELAGAVGAHPGALYRLLRALAAVDVFQEDAERRFSLTPMGECLRSDAAEPMGEWAAYIGRPFFWETWGQLLYSIQTGENAFSHLHEGQNVWEWRAGQPEENAIFNRAMAGLSRRSADSFLDAYDFGRFATIADIGGGNGSMLAAILGRHREASGILFDLPHVVDGARQVLDKAGIANRCQVIGGSFFEEIPAGADAYILKAVLHDWDETELRAHPAKGAGRLLNEGEAAGPRVRDWSAKRGSALQVLGSSTCS